MWLRGKRVVITRAMHQAECARALLEAKGAHPIIMPTIAILAAPDRRPLIAALQRLDTYDHLIITSANSAAPLAEVFARADIDPAQISGVKISAVGPSSADALRVIGLPIDRVAVNYRAEGLVEVLRDDSRAGQRVLIVGAEKMRDTLPKALRARGLMVDQVAAYRTNIPEEAVYRAGYLALERREVQAVTFTSGSTARHFAKILGGDLECMLDRVMVAAIGPITAKTCEAFGFPAAIVPKMATLPALIDAMDRADI